MKSWFELLKPEPKPTSRTDPFMEAASRAATILAMKRKLVHQKRGPDTRRWTGRVFGRRAWVGQPVVLPDNGIGWIKQAQAGMVCVRTAVVDPVDGPVHDYLKAIALKPYKMPEAVLLGSRKRGKKERSSAVKAAASRANGKLPPKPGSRPRGRPRISNSRQFDNRWAR